MPDSKKNNVTPPTPRGTTAAACKTALAGTYKALKAYSFYPESHPLRERILHSSFQTLAHAAKDDMLSFVVNRNGFSFADGRTPVESTPMTKALAQELFAREIQRLVVLPAISFSDFTGFLSLLSQDPPKIVAAGGLTALLKQNGIETIAVNEIDITAVFTRKRGEQELEEASAPLQGGDPGQPCSNQLAGEELDRLSQMSIEELLELMSLESADNQYRQLAQLLLVKAQPLRQERSFDRLFAVLIAMIEQHTDPTRSAACRQQALAVLQQLTPGEVTEHLLDHLEDAEFGQKELVFLILQTVGAEVVEPVIRRLIAVGFKASRKTFTTALLRIGSPAEPALFALLKDGRWQVVLAAIAILAELGSRDAVKGLVLTAQHSDNRVRMESIRALAFIGGMEATQALLELLQDPDQAVAQHAITWLGNTKNNRALQPLLQLIWKRDLRGRITPLKKEALHAIGKIGDRRVLDPLFKMVSRRYWLFPGRWNGLKVAALEAIGNLGGDQARQFLTQVAAGGGHLGRIASADLDALSKRNPDHHG